MPSEAARDVLWVLHACRAIELAMAGLYQTLAELHAHHTAVSRLWRKTAREEHNHAAQFSLLIDGIPETIDGATIDARALDGLRRTVEATTAAFRERAPSVGDALVAAINLEESLDRIHAHQGLVFANPRIKRMFEAMMAADAGHVSELRAALQKQGRKAPGR